MRVAGISLALGPKWLNAINMPVHPVKKANFTVTSSLFKTPCATSFAKPFPKIRLSLRNSLQLCLLSASFIFYSLNMLKFFLITHSACEHF